MQIYGNGFIASNLKKLKSKKNVFIYAAGVSNSNNKKSYHYKREISTIKKIIEKINPNLTFVYISSLSVENKKLKKNKYIKNKLKIEKIVKDSFIHYLIIRLPQVVGRSKNKHTLTNSIYENIKKNKNFLLWKNAKRNILDIEDIIRILNKYFMKNLNVRKTLNIYNPRSTSVEFIIKTLGIILKKDILFKEIICENKNINLSNIKNNTKLPKNLYRDINKENYVTKVLKKYYK
tara:strand:+ start:29204 stop:29905 length:702 start_codon:yes stop_codon:yes gene_type:complete